MKRLLLSFAVVGLLFGSASSARAQVTFDFHIGHAPPPPRAYAVPPQPGPDYLWIEGYRYPVNGRYTWHNGYWTRPPYAGAYWVAPYHTGSQYYAGHWEGSRANIYHDHKWDKDSHRDEGRDNHGRGRGHNH